MKRVRRSRGRLCKNRPGQTPGVSQFFGCTPLGSVGWSIAGLAAGAATVAPGLLPDW
jgi:hypothetical protein